MSEVGVQTVVFPTEVGIVWLGLEMFWVDFGTFRSIVW